MKLSGSAALVLLAIVGVAAGCGGTKTVTETTTVTVSTPTSTGLAPPRERVEFGHIKTLTPTGTNYTLRFDPAWFLSGKTANVAAAEDGVVAPGEAVPNDNYVVDESHRLFTYIVPPDAKVTVLTRHGDPAQLGATPISVAQLAKIVDGTSTLKLFEPLDSGAWITVDIDTVRRIDQQYRP